MFNKPVELTAEVTKPNPAAKLDGVISVLEEKLCREYSLTRGELRALKIIIKNGEVTIEGKK